MTDEDTPPYGPRDHWTHHYGGSREWYRHTWTTEDLAAHLTDALDGGPHATGSAQIQDAGGNVVGHLISDEYLRQLTEAAEQIEKLTEQPKDTALHQAVQGPRTEGDGGLIMDTQLIRSDLAWTYARAEIGGPPKRGEPGPGLDEWRARVKERADQIEAEDRHGLLGSAVHIAYSLTLPADDHGIVPIRAWSSREREAETVAHWQLAYTTPARGLFVRAGNPNLWGEEYSVVGGAGYAIRHGFISREIATDFAVALAEAVPGIDWRVWDAPKDSMTPAIREAITAVMHSWDSYGPRKQAPPVPASN